jgi:Na+-transporting NADH:ubiquinone oxidoreductase subunit NqrC
MNWIAEHWKDVLAIIGGVVTVASLIVKLTPTQKDDNILAKIIKILAIIGIFNPDGSSIGKCKEESK